jgi:hypothetical protein
MQRNTVDLLSWTLLTPPAEIAHLPTGRSWPRPAVSVTIEEPQSKTRNCWGCYGVKNRHPSPRRRNAQGADSSFANRKALAKRVGITNYSGTAEQNLELWSELSGNPKPVQSTSSTVRAGQQNAKDNPSYYVNGSSSGSSRSSSTTNTIYGIDEDRYNSMPYFAKEAARTYYNETHYPSYSGSSSSSYSAPKREENTLNPLEKSLDSFQEMGSDFYNSAQTRTDKALDSPEDFANYMTIGGVDVAKGIWDASAERADKAFDSPYDFANWLSSGIVGMANGAIDPEDPFSKEHWLNSAGLAGLAAEV